MSQENGHGNPTRKDAALPSTTLQIVINYDQITGAIQVNGAIQSYMVFCGIVECAKDAVKKHIEANASPIARPGNLLSLQ